MTEEVAHRNHWEIFEVIFGVPFLSLSEPELRAGLKKLDSDISGKTALY